jgi:hypothetical protein
LFQGYGRNLADKSKAMLKAVALAELFFANPEAPF